MSIKDVAEKADIWSEAIKKIVKAITAAGVALAVAIGGVLMWWPFGVSEPGGESPVDGWGSQCSQLYSAMDHTWTESQWSVWEQLRKDLDC